MGIEKYSTTPANNATAGSVNFAEGQAPSSINDSARQLMADVKEWHIDAEWLKVGENGSANAYSISYVSATVFKFTGTDRRTLAAVGRRVKAGVGAGTIYGTIATSSLSASDTQVTCTFDSGQLDTSLSYVSLGVLATPNQSNPSPAKMVSFTRDMTAADGSQAVTGVGFKPRAIIFIAGFTSSVGACWGMYDGSSNALIYANQPAGADTFNALASGVIVLTTSAGTSQSAAMASLDADGFTVTWTKTGSPGAATATIFAMCFR